MSPAILIFDDSYGKESGVYFINYVDRFLMHGEMDLCISFLLFYSTDRTILMSKRWRPLCTSHSNLRFSDSNDKICGPHFISCVNKYSL